jgi:peptide subunit release factor 1 (eRF1)
MISRAQVDSLLEFQNGDCLVTSCYLNLDRAKQQPQMLKIRVKDLLQSAKQRLVDKLGSHAQFESLRADFGFIEEFAMQEIFAGRHKALAMFSCAAHKLWQTYSLPPIPRNILVADLAPYVRPLLAILSRHRRYCVVLADRSVGQLFEVYMGEILERTDVVDTVPRRVKDGGLGGRDERNMERRHDQAIQQHFQRLADATFKLFKRDRFDYLILGGQGDLLEEFKKVLHPYLKERWVSDFPAKPFSTSPSDVLARVLEMGEQFEREQEKRLAEELVHKISAGNRAVSGVTATLAAILRGEAQTLLVEEGFETPGYVCHHCRYGSLAEENCPHCHQALTPCPDIVEATVELALEKNCQIEHVRTPTPLHDLGRVGALLRYQA